MTEPDPVAALAAQLEQLRGQLARSQGEIGVLREKLKAESGQTMMLRLDVKQLTDRLNEAMETHALEPVQAPYWAGLSREDLDAQLAELRQWVESFLRPHYPGYRPGSRDAGRPTARLCGSCRRSPRNGSGSTATRRTVILPVRSPGMTGSCRACWLAWPPLSTATRPAAGRPPPAERVREGPGALPLRPGLLHVLMACQGRYISASMSAAASAGCQERSGAGSASAWTSGCCHAAGW